MANKSSSKSEQATQEVPESCQYCRFSLVSSDKQTVTCRRHAPGLGGVWCDISRGGEFSSWRSRSAGILTALDGWCGDFEQKSGAKPGADTSREHSRGTVLVPLELPACGFPKVPTLQEVVDELFVYNCHANCADHDGDLHTPHHLCDLQLVDLARRILKKFGITILRDRHGHVAPSNEQTDASGPASIPRRLLKGRATSAYLDVWLRCGPLPAAEAARAVQALGAK